MMRLVPIPEVMNELVNISQLYGALLLLSQSWSGAFALQARQASVSRGLVIREQVSRWQLLG